jgi:hypothetical protein
MAKTWRTLFHKKAKLVGRDITAFARRIDSPRRLPMFRSPEPGRGAHDSRLIRRFELIET